jgi:hypothetical protein
LCVRTVPQLIDSRFDLQTILADTLLGTANRRHKLRVARLGGADAVHQQIAAVRLHDHLKPLDGIEQVLGFFISIAWVHLDPPAAQSVVRLLAGAALLLESVWIKNPLLSTQIPVSTWLARPEEA